MITTTLPEVYRGPGSTGMFFAADELTMVAGRRGRPPALLGDLEYRHWYDAVPGARVPRTIAALLLQDEGESASHYDTVVHALASPGEPANALSITCKPLPDTASTMKARYGKGYEIPGWKTTYALRRYPNTDMGLDIVTVGRAVTYEGGEVAHQVKALEDATMAQAAHAESGDDTADRIAWQVAGTAIMNGQTIHEANRAEYALGLLADISAEELAGLHGLVQVLRERAYLA